MHFNSCLRLPVVNIVAFQAHPSNPRSFDFLRRDNCVSLSEGFPDLSRSCSPSAVYGSFRRRLPHLPQPRSSVLQFRNSNRRKGTCSLASILKILLLIVSQRLHNPPPLHLNPPPSAAHIHPHPAIPYNPIHHLSQHTRNARSAPQDLSTSRSCDPADPLWTERYV